MIRQDRKKVFIGLSGGVDSAVSATLLKRAGYDITGVFIKVWQPDWIECSWREDRLDAMRVAAHLDIPFITLDLEKEYKHEVIDYMIEEYKRGKTPNPDVMCNRTIKFGAFYDWAMQNGGDFVATGHYARIRCQNIVGADLYLREAFSPHHYSRFGEKGSLRHASAPDNVKYSLSMGKDSNKDQSYFLWTLKQEQLPHILFPVGNMTKPEVRKLAKRFDLPNADKKDSQGLCFIGKVDVKDFLSHYIERESGNVLNMNGEIIGKHPGSLFFTIGERHGFSLDKKTPNDEPMYVVDKDIEQNTITVGVRLAREVNVSDLMNTSSEQISIEQVNWIRGSVPENFKDKIFTARTRYRQRLEKIRIISVTFTETIIEFMEKQENLASGQSLVIYDGDECFGGGVIS
ncbi:MAG: tRNA 2-thiouridine(34) synthase MnmA [Candidatus Paceibacterota bacterium]|jgi:tRNA-specific 2-thiouridylase